MSSRAQEIRQKRLDERKAIEEAKKEIAESHKVIVETEAKRLFEWVLDMFEYPTKDNTKDRVVLYDMLGTIFIDGYDDGISETFDYEVMGKLADMFEAEEGYKVEFSKYVVDAFEFPSLVISIE